MMREGRLQWAVNIAAGGGSNGGGFEVSRTPVAESNATDMSGLLLQAPPRPGEGGAGPDVRHNVGRAVSFVCGLPTELGASEGKLGAGQDGKLVPGLGVPVERGGAEVGVNEVISPTMLSQLAAVSR